MERLKKAVELIVGSIQRALSSLDPAVVEEFIALVLNSERSFIYGAGRSGLAARAFAQRLMHIGLLGAYVIGETVTPAMSDQDLLIVYTGSGETPSTIMVCKMAKEVRAKVAVITSNPNSSAAKLADCVVQLRVEREPEAADLALLGTTFEAIAWVLGDGLAAELKSRLGVTEREMAERHANVQT